MMIVPFTNINAIKELVFSQLLKVKWKETEKPTHLGHQLSRRGVHDRIFQLGTSNHGIAASCKSMYFDGHELLIMKLTQDIHLDTRQIVVDFDDINGKGLEAFVLWKLEDAIELYRTEMDLPNNSQWFKRGQYCKTSGTYDGKDSCPSRRQCELMIMPSHEPRDPDGNNDDDGFQPEDWPCVVFETGPSMDNVACRQYLHFGVDWWFSQSRGMVKTVFLLFFNREKREIVIEKWGKELLDMLGKKKKKKKILMQGHKG